MRLHELWSNKHCWKCVRAIEAILDQAQEAFGTDADWVAVDTSDRPVYKYGDGKHKQGLSKVRVKVQPGGQNVAHQPLHAHERKRVPVLSVVCQLNGCAGSSGQLLDG